MYSHIFCHIFSCSSIIMKKNVNMLPKIKNKKITVCLVLFFGIGVQLPFAKPLVHYFAEQKQEQFCFGNGHNAFTAV